MTRAPEIAELLKISGLFEMIDIHFGSFLHTLAQEHHAELFMAGALLSRYTREGHTCTPVEKLNEGLQELRGALLDGQGDRREPADALPSSLSLDHVNESGLAGRKAGGKPLVTDGSGRLYLEKYWQYEQMVTRIIQALALSEALPVDEFRLRDGVERLFPRDEEATEPDWQKIAALAAVFKRLSVITGGPGTGKTTTVARVLALLLEQKSELAIALAAPTGKAAGRLEESLKNSIHHLSLRDEIKAKMPVSASTIHRLLGAVIHSPTFRHDSLSPLAADVVVVDEASMVDLPLMAKLLDALKPTGRLILVGDKNQLASVETGSVFGDICAGENVDAMSGECAAKLKMYEKCPFPPAPGPSTGWLTDCVIELKKNYRTAEGSAIVPLSKKIIQGSDDEVIRALTICNAQKSTEITWRDLPKKQQFAREFQARVKDFFAGYAGTADVGTAFKKLAAFRILSPVRKGWCGIEALNGLVEALMPEHGRGSRIYRLKPLLITSNDYNLKLYNGDLGIVFPDEQEALRVFFESDRGPGEVHRRFFAGCLPEYEPAYAMTVHKSQGSEFDHVLLILPEEENPLLTRELIYTAITRARKSVEIWGSERIIRAAVRKKVERLSGVGRCIESP